MCNNGILNPRSWNFEILGAILEAILGAILGYMGDYPLGLVSVIRLKFITLKFIFPDLIYRCRFEMEMLSRGV